MWIAIRRFLGRKERQGPHGRRSAVVQNKTFVFESADKSAWLHLITSVERGLWRQFNARKQELTVILHDGIDVAACFLILVASRSSAVHLPDKARSAVCIDFCSPCID